PLSSFASRWFCATSMRVGANRRLEPGGTMSIATMRGDGGQTGLAGGIRVSKADLRVEAYGTIDELISYIGLARAMCTEAEVCDFAKSIQRDLFKVGSAIATPEESPKPQPQITDDMVD